MKRTFKNWQAELLTIISGCRGYHAARLVVENAEADLKAGNISQRAFCAAKRWAKELYWKDRIK
jgi:hypothetical protein